MAAKLVAAAAQDARRTNEHRRMGVVTAGVHVPLDATGEIETRVLVDRKRIHVPAKQHRSGGGGPYLQTAVQTRKACEVGPDAALFCAMIGFFLSFWSRRRLAQRGVRPPKVLTNHCRFCAQALDWATFIVRWPRPERQKWRK